MADVHAFDTQTPGEAPAAEAADQHLQSVGYMARQPILDRRGTVFGYELHFHAPFEEGGEAAPAGASNGLLNALSIFGVKRFTAGTWGFLNCSLDAVVDETMEGLCPTLSVLEIPRRAEAAPKLIRACRKFRDLGFRIALLNFESSHAADPLLEMADYVKVDANVFETPGWDHLCRQLEGTHAAVIADKIHAHDTYRKARALGIAYFQGYYFCNPELIPSSQIPVCRAQQVQILRQLFKEPLDLKALCPLVSRDPSLVYRVLRFVNSPLCAIRNPVTSIESAMLILGDLAFRRIATLAIQCALNQDQSPELLNMALVRARFCAQAASLCGFDPEEQYLLGMLSLLPPMLRVPMTTILPELPLRDELRNALAGTPCKERSLLAWIEHLEENRIAGCDEISETYSLDRTRLAELYLNSLQDAAVLAQLS